MAPAEDSSAERESVAAVSNSTAEEQDQDVFINPLPAAAVSAASEPGGEAAPQHPVGSSEAAQPHAALDIAPAAAHLPAQLLADDDADVSEAHALLPQHHAHSADAHATAHHGSDAEERGHDGSDSDSVSLDSPAAGRPPDCSAVTTANPYFQIHGALRTPLEDQPNSESSSSRGHKLLLAGLGALPLQARRMLPETLLSLLQCRERQDAQLALDADDHLPGCKVREEDVMRKVNRHLLSRFLMLTMLCYLDRTNLAFAALQLNRDLGFSELVFGAGSSIFFITYALAQVPSNMALVRVGGAVWLGVIVTLWGIVATCFAGLSSATMFYVLRLLLGLMEAGTFPGLWWMLTQFYTTPEVAVAYAICQAGSVISQVFGAPLAAALLAMDGILGLDGWQWLFLAEGLPTIAFGLWLRCSLAETPATAKFLRPEERTWLAARNEAHKAMGGSLAEVEWEGILHWKTWALASLDCCISTTKYALLYFTPLIIYHILGRQAERAQAARGGGAGTPGAEHANDDFETFGDEGPSEVLVALLTALPFAVAALSTVGNAWHSKRSAERRWHVVVPLVLSALAMCALAAFMSSHAGLAFAALMVTVLAWAPGGILSAYPSSYLSGPAAASGWAVVNAFGALVGGLVGPFLVGTLKHVSGDYRSGTLVLAGVMAAGAAFAATVLPIISPDSTLQPKRAGGCGGADPDAEEAAGRSPKAGRRGSVSDDAKADARSDGGVQLVPLRSPC